MVFAHDSSVAAAPSSLSGAYNKGVSGFGASHLRQNPASQDFRYARNVVRNSARRYEVHCERDEKWVGW